MIELSAFLRYGKSRNIKNLISRGQTVTSTSASILTGDVQEVFRVSSAGTLKQKVLLPR
jgi:hypothetical protein